MSSAVVLASGGINSAVVLEIALRAHRPDTVYMVSFEYESKYNEQERLTSLDLYSHYNDRGENVTWEPIEIAGPNVTPFLDGILLLRAAAYAITKGASYIYTGMTRNDTYEFIKSMEDIIYIDSEHATKLKSPLSLMTKATIIKRAYDLEVPVNLTWSCRQPVLLLRPAGSGPERWVHCGECSKCIERMIGFSKVSVVDPVPYAIKLEWNTTALWPFKGEKQLRAGKL